MIGIAQRRAFAGIVGLGLLVCGADSGMAGVITSGFNDVSGINGDGSPDNSPFNTGGASLHGQGAGEPGWDGPWFMSVGSAVVGTTAFEGDGAAAFFQGTAAADRKLSQAPVDLFSITFQLMIPVAPSLDVIFRVYDSAIPSIFSAIAVQWNVTPTFEIGVLDGIEDSIDLGAPYSENTGMFLTPGNWHEITTLIDPVSRTWNIALDGVLYSPPDPLGFRGVPVHLDSIQFLNEINSPNGSSIDAFVIDTELSPSAIPEPSASILVGFGVLALVGRRTRFRIRS